jgi:hypothetical protein
MAAIPVEKRLVGGMDWDTNPQDVKQTDYLEAENITTRSTGQNEQVDIYPLRGEEYPFDNSLEYAQTNIFTSGRTVRIYCPRDKDPSSLPAVLYGNIIIRNENGSPVTPSSPGIIGGTTFSTWAGDLNLYLAGMPSGYDGVAIYTATPESIDYEGVIDIRVTKIGRYTIEFNSTVPTYTLPIQIMEDVISTNFIARGEVPKIIGSARDARGTYLFVTPVPEKNMNEVLKARPGNPTIVSVTNVVRPTVGSNTDIEFDLPHGLFQWERILIEGRSGGETHINGYWQVSVIDPFTVALFSSDLTIYVPGPGSGGNVTFLHDTIGSILYVENSKEVLGDIEGNYGANLTNLITTTAFNFAHSHPIDARAKYNNFNSILKFTDNYDKPKMMIYRGYPFVEQGYLYGSGINGDPISFNGLYFLETISQQSDIQLPATDFKLSVTQLPEDGSLKAKNRIYLAAGVTTDGNISQYSFPTNPIQVLEKNAGAFVVDEVDSWEYTGNKFNDSTTRRNQVLISNIPPNIFSFVKVVCLEYTPLAFELKEVGRVFLSPGQTEAQIIHTGDEPAVVVDTLEISQVYAAIDRALNIEEVSNCTVLSNVQIGFDEDLTPVSKAIDYELKYIQLSAGPYGPLPASLTDFFPLGEYADVISQPSEMGFMPFETSRWGIIFKKKGGGWTKTYPICDIRMDDNPTAPNRIAGLPSLRFIRRQIPIINFTNLDWEYILPSGLRLRDVYDDAKFVRANVAREVIAFGYAFISGDIGSFTYMYGGGIFGAPTPGATSFTDSRKYLYFMSFDLMNSNGLDYIHQSGDKLICLGCPSLDASTAATAPANSFLYEFGAFGSDSATYQELDIEDAQILSQTSSVTVGGKFMLAQDLNGDITGANAYKWPLASNIYGLKVDADITNATNTTNPDIFVYACFIVRPTSQPYPINPADNTYFDVGFNGVDAKTDDASTGYAIVQGGDTYAQNTYMGLRIGDVGGVAQYYAGLGFLSYNKGNAQTTERTFPGGYLGATPASLQDCIDSFVSAPAVTVSGGGYLSYSPAFTKRLFFPRLSSYDPNKKEIGTQQATVYWSLESIEDSVWNRDRIFLPLNKRDLDLSYGPIMGMFRLNEILVTVQPDYIERQYFDNTGKLVSDSGDVLLGTGEVMGRKGDAISLLGSNNKWSMFVGLSQSGNQFLYGVDGKRRKLWRVGLDGTTVISDQYNFQNFVKKYVTLAPYYDNPIIQRGLTGVFDVKNNAAIFTSLIYNDDNVTQWESGVSYNAGDLVTDENCDYLHESIPVIFRAKINNTGSSTNRPRNRQTSSATWDVIPLTNTDFYNVWTAVFYEDENIFKTFLGYYHYHMAGFQDTFIVLPNSNRLTAFDYETPSFYVHREKSAILNWYPRVYFVATPSYSWAAGDTFISFLGLSDYVPASIYWGNMVLEFNLNGEYRVATAADENAFYFEEPLVNAGSSSQLEITVYLSKDAYIKAIINENRGMLVKFCNTRFDSLIAPERVDLNTPQHESYLVSDDFTSFDTVHASAIKMDITNGGTPDTGTSVLFGKYLTLKVKFKRLVEQFIHKFDVAIRAMPSEKKRR